jgi:hypothetical protein
MLSHDSLSHSLVQLRFAKAALSQNLAAQQEAVGPSPLLTSFQLRDLQPTNFDGKAISEPLTKDEPTEGSPSASAGLS